MTSFVFRDFILVFGGILNFSKKCIFVEFIDRRTFEFLDFKNWQPGLFFINLSLLSFNFSMLSIFIILKIV
jgi:hypothetical protein